MNTETILRKHFGLKGDFLSKGFQKHLKSGSNDLYEEAIYSPETENCWDRLLRLIDDLEEMGAIDEDTSIAIAHSLCDNA